MKKKELSYSKHHIVPSSIWGATTPRNLETLRVSTHRAIHTLFENRTIAHQLLRTIDLSEKAMKPEVVKWLRETLTALDPSDLHEWYIDDVLDI